MGRMHTGKTTPSVNAQLMFISMINIGLKNIWLPPQSSYSVKMTRDAKQEGGGKRGGGN